MNTQTFVGTPGICTAGSSALSFDTSRMTQLIANRDNRFHLDLSGSNLVQIVEAKEMFSKRQSPHYSLSAVVTAIKRLESVIGFTILPIDVTDEFYIEFQNFLLSVPGPSGKVCKPSTISTYLSLIQGALNWASKHRAAVSETYSCWNTPQYEKPKIALSPSMIAHIYYFDLSSKTNREKFKDFFNKKSLRKVSFSFMERVRDQFVLMCQLGQRYSDACRIDETNFDDTKTIFHCTQQKTGNRAVVNLAKYAIDKSIAFEILNKYNYKAPTYGKDICTVNKYLHLLCMVIGKEFDKIHVGENKINGELVVEKYNAFSLITTHTARRTFITYWANNKEMNIVRLQKCTGHKDVRQISRYTILSDED